MTQRTKSIAKVVTAVTIAILAIGIAPSLAEAQARGTLQVSAKVIVADNAFRALDAVKAAVSSVGRPDAARGANSAPTVARVSVARDPKALVVTVDYSRS